MKIFTLLFLLASFWAQAQRSEFSIDDLVSFTAYSPGKFETLLLKKGFKPHETDTSVHFEANTFHKMAKDSSSEMLIGKQESNNEVALLFQTNSTDEFEEMKRDLKKEGYFSPDSIDLPLYQKGNITVQPLLREIKGQTLYQFIIERKMIPRAKDINYAEDLLQLNSNEMLASVFGQENIRKDMFYFSEKETNRCTVLFPNTSLQVIFIWKDELNLRNIDFLIIGGTLRAQSSYSYYKPVELNKWQSKQGIFSGMSLKELLERNGKDVRLYGFESEQAGLVLKENTGKIDFKRIGAQLSCLDCNEDRYYSRTGILNGTDLLRDNRRVYVSTIIILPEKKGNQ